MKRVLITDDRDPVIQKIARHLMDAGHEVLFGAIDPNLAFTDVIHPAPPPVRATIEDASEEKWKAGFESGALSSMMVMQTACEALKEKGGAIIFLGSIHAEKPMGEGFLFSMGCAATQMLVREAALAYGKYSVRAFYVKRGAMAHDQGNFSAYSNVYAAMEARYSGAPMQTPEDLFGLIDFLLTPGSAPLNGLDIDADAAYTMYYGQRRE